MSAPWASSPHRRTRDAPQPVGSDCMQKWVARSRGSSRTRATLALLNAPDVPTDVAFSVGSGRAEPGVVVSGGPARADVTSKIYIQVDP